MNDHAFNMWLPQPGPQPTTPCADEPVAQEKPMFDAAEAIERKVHDIHTGISDLTRPDDANLEALAPHEAELLSSLTFLQLLCSALREKRLAKVKHLEAAE